MASEKLTVFISHPSHFLTDYRPHGDGLAAFAFIRYLAPSVNELHVAVPLADIKGKLPPNVHLHPIRTFARPSASEQSILFRIEYAYRVRRLFTQLNQSSRIDIIHQLNPGVLGLSFFLSKLGAPLAIGPLTPSWEIDEPNSFSRFLGRLKRNIKLWFTRQNFRKCDAVFTPTQASAQFIQDASPRTLAVPLPFGVDTDQFHPNYSVAPTLPTILFLANLQQRKGIHTLLEAFELLWPTMAKAHLIIGGDGPEREAVRAVVDNARSRQNITLLGNVPRDVICSTMQRCSVYCLPSFGEPFGLSALEAMSCGKPLVVSNAGGLAELVRLEGGIRVRPGDVCALSFALRFLLERNELQRQMGSFNRDLVLEKYRWGVVADSLLTTYTSLASASSMKNDKHLPRLEAKS